MMNKKRIFVCSRLRGKNQEEVSKHIKEAQRFSKFIMKRNLGYPYVPHLLYTQFLDDNNPKDRELGIEAGFVYLEICDEMFAYVDEDEYISEGMRAEIQFAIDHGIWVRVFVAKNGTYIQKKNIVQDWLKSTE